MTEFKVGDKVRLTGQLWGDDNSPQRGDTVEIAGYDDAVHAPYFQGDEETPWFIWNDGDWNAELVEPARRTVDDIYEEEYGAKELGVDPVEEGDRLKAIIDVGELAKSLSIEPKDQSDFVESVNRITGNVAALLIEKNQSYGNAALDPIRVFSNASAEEQLLVRIDDKLSRIQRGHEYQGEDTILDLLGYLVILLIAREAK